MTDPHPHTQTGGPSAEALDISHRVLGSYFGTPFLSTTMKACAAEFALALDAFAEARVRVEREACARLVDSMLMGIGVEGQEAAGTMAYKSDVGQAIRATSSTTPTATQPEAIVEGKNAGWAYGLVNCRDCKKLTNDYTFVVGQPVCMDCRPEPADDKCTACRGFGCTWQKAEQKGKKGHQVDCPSCNGTGRASG